MSVWIVLATVVLLLVNAFFVGAEFAAMASRRSQLEPLAARGSKRARIAVDALRHTGILLATSQLGITVCSVLLGALSEAALHDAFVRWLAPLGIPVGLLETVSLTLAVLTIVFLHVVVGEMIPKNIAIATPERAAVTLVPVLVAVTKVFAPVIIAMDWLAKHIVRLMGVEPRDEVSAAYTAEEVQHIVAESHREGRIARDRVGLAGAALEFSDKDAIDVAVSLDDLVTVTSTATPNDIERLVARHGFSRYPVVGADGVPFGYLHLKDILYADEDQRAEPVPPRRIRRLAMVRPADEVELVLRTMQETGAHLARVVGDAGRILGVVFLEDVIEELVGEVTDATQR